MNAFRQLLRAAGSKPPIGTWISSASPIVAEAIGHAGFDWGVLDMEHAPLDLMPLVHLLQAVGNTKMVPVVRVPWNDAVTVKRVLDAGAQTLLFPSYDGNGMYLSTGNTLENPAVGLLFIDFENRKRFRLNGTASIVPAGSIEPAYLEAQFVVKVHVTQVFPNCPRYIHKMQMVERSSFAPRAGVATPVPAWKRMEWSCDVLPEGDPARLPDDPGGRAGA